MNSLLRPSGLILTAILLSSCGQEPEPQVSISTPDTAEVRPEIYADFTLTADLDHLSDDQKQMIVLLIEAGQAMDEAFWIQAYGDKAALMDSIDDADTRRFAELNFSIKATKGTYDCLATACIAAEPILKMHEARPNIVFILADDLGWADLPSYGNTFNEAPNLEQMSREGMQFSNAFRKIFFEDILIVFLNYARDGQERLQVLSYTNGTRAGPASAVRR